MASSARTCSFSALLLLLAAGSATAQKAFDECDAATVAQMTAAQLGAWVSFAPETLKRRFAPARAAGKWSVIVDSLRILYGVDPAPAGLPHPPATIAALTPTDRATLASELDMFRDELRAGERDSAMRINGFVAQKRFDVSMQLMVPPHRATLFPNHPPNAIELAPTVPLPDDDVRSVCWLTIAVRDLAALYGGAARASLAAALAERATRWDNFSRHGYSMTPLELFVNGRMPRAELEPPRTQLVLGHVSPGEQMFSDRGAHLESFRRRTVLVFEPLGFVKYSERFDSYGGATIVLAYPDSGGLAPGVMLHHSSLGHVAGVWRPKGPTDSGRWALLLSLDLYRFLSGAQDQMNRMKNEAFGTCLADVPSCLKKVGAP